MRLSIGLAFKIFLANFVKQSSFCWCRTRLYSFKQRQWWRNNGKLPQWIMFDQLPIQRILKSHHRPGTLLLSGYIEVFLSDLKQNCVILNVKMCFFPRRRRFAWGGRFTPRNQKNSETPPTPNRLNTLSIATPARPSNIDLQTYIDTQSPGLTSRLVKYHEESQRKMRPLINPLYTRFGDFPLANSKKTEKPKQSLAAAIKPTAKITPPIRTNYMMASRAMIMSAGRMGSSEASGYANTNGVRVAAAATVPNENEPLVNHDDDYEPAPTRSSLDALQEISRKRIHCQDLDNDQSKKAKADAVPPNTVAPNEYSGGAALKRGRDQTSPSYQKSAPEAQKKRFSRCNDIFSSLSSSLHLLTPKRKLSEC